jgi:hypothetical protein
MNTNFTSHLAESFYKLITKEITAPFQVSHFNNDIFSFLTIYPIYRKRFKTFCYSMKYLYCIQYNLNKE